MSRKIVCTIATRSYLPFARTLAHSLLEFNEDLTLYVLLADRIDEHFNPHQEPFKFIFLEDLADQETIGKMCFYYTPFELCCALRGFLHEYIYENHLADSWLFLDSDILVFSSLQEIFHRLESTSILLTPHTLEPFNQDLINLLEVSILASGNYNAGFLGLRRTEETRRFIAWFKHRLSYYSFSRRGDDMLKYLFVDQLWLNFVPHFFQEVEFLEHPGANAGYWNLISRSITKQNDQYFIDGQPLLFVHFSGWDIDCPEKLSKHLPHEIQLDYWQEWAEQYKRLLQKYGYETCKDLPYGFGSFADGSIITPEMRQRFYRQINHAESSLEDPFSAFYYFQNPSTQPTKSILRRALEKASLGLNRIAAMV